VSGDASPQSPEVKFGSTLVKLRVGNAALGRSRDHIRGRQ
jgi:hypothetical protein